VRLLLYARDHHQGLAEVGLCFPGSMREGYEHLTATQQFAAYVVLHDGVAARELVLFSEPIEDPLGRMPLLGRPLLVIFQNGVNHALPRSQLRPLDRLLPLIARWHSVLQHLPHRISRQPKLPGHRTLTLAINTYRSPNSTVYLHLKHPSGVP
jgi:hypothetical protein